MSLLRARGRLRALEGVVTLRRLGAPGRERRECGQTARRPLALFTTLVVLALLTSAAAAGAPGARLVAAAVSGWSAPLATAARADAPARGAATGRPPADLARTIATDATSILPLPAATASQGLPVAPLGRLVQPDLLVLVPAGIAPADRAALRALPGVNDTLPLAVGPVSLGGTAAKAIAADPGQLRRWTPGPTARSDGLWRAVAAGELTSSFDLGKNLRLPLGGQVPVHGPGRPVQSLRLGALASLALPGLDLTVAPPAGTALGLTPDAGLLMSAPHADLPGLRDRIRSRLGSGSDVLLLHEVTVVRDTGAFLTRAQIASVLRAALSRVGAPYVWGATGPDAFDCSGLVGYAFAAAGVAVPRTSEQLWLAGPHVPAARARPGDLLFWANDPAAPDDMDHVALYLGNGLMVSAPHTGDVVHVAPVYVSNFRGVVRLDPAAAGRVGGGTWTPGVAAGRA